MSDSVNDTIQLFERYRAADSRAADALFQRYVQRLTALVRARLSAKLARRIDAEDVVQSAYRTFFAQAAEGAYELKRGGDLWRLLAAIALNKLRKQIERNVAAKRAISAEESAAHFAGELPVEQMAACSEPTPDEEAALSEELSWLLADADACQRQMLEMRLAGFRLEEIAVELNRSERTVRRFLEKTKARWEARLQALNGAEPGTGS